MGVLAQGREAEGKQGRQNGRRQEADRQAGREAGRERRREESRVCVRSVLLLTAVILLALAKHLLLHFSFRGGEIP